MNEEFVNIDVEKIVKHWVETSEEDFNTLITLFNSKSYSWALFLGHISTEKLLKAYYVKKFEKARTFYS
jgi:HEPN domain-containing protein